MSKENKFHLLTLIIAIIMLLVFSVDVYAGEYPIYGFTLYSGDYIAFHKYAETGSDHEVRYDNCYKYPGSIVLGGNEFSLNIRDHTLAGRVYIELYMNDSRVETEQYVDIDGDGHQETLYGARREGVKEGQECGFCFENKDNKLSMYIYYINTQGNKYLSKVIDTFTSAIDGDFSEPYRLVDEASKEQIDDFIDYQSYHGKDEYLRIGWQEEEGYKAVYIAFPQGSNWVAYEKNVVDGVGEYWFECEAGYSILWPWGSWVDYVAGVETMLTDCKLVGGENPVDYYEGDEGEYFTSKINIEVDGVNLRKNDVIRLLPGEVSTEKVIKVNYVYRNMDIEGYDEEKFEVDGITVYGEYLENWNKTEYGKVTGTRSLVVHLQKGEVYNIIVAVSAQPAMVLKSYRIRVIGHEEKVDMDNDGYDDETGEPMPGVIEPPSGGIIGYLRWIVENMHNGIVGIGDTIGKIFGSIKPLVEGVGMMVSWLPGEVQSLLILSVSIGFLLMLIGR